MKTNNLTQYFNYNKVEDTKDSFQFIKAKEKHFPNSIANSHKAMFLASSLALCPLINSVNAELPPDVNIDRVYQKTPRCIKSSPYIKEYWISQIHDLERLEDNWDCYGAIKVLPECINNALNIVLSTNYCYIKDIYANPNGTISILWKNSNSESIGLEIGESSMSYYVDIKSGTYFQDNQLFSADSYSQLSSYINLL